MVIFHRLMNIKHLQYVYIIIKQIKNIFPAVGTGYGGIVRGPGGGYGDCIPVDGVSAARQGRVFQRV